MTPHKKIRLPKLETIWKFLQGIRQFSLTTKGVTLNWKYFLQGRVWSKVYFIRCSKCFQFTVTPFDKVRNLETVLSFVINERKGNIYLQSTFCHLILIIFISELRTLSTWILKVYFIRCSKCFQFTVTTT